MGRKPNKKSISPQEIVSTIEKILELSDEERLVELNRFKRKAEAAIEHQRQSKKGWYESNKKEINERARQWQEENPERFKELQRKHYRKNKKKIREYQREYQKEYQKKRREKEKELQEEVERLREELGKSDKKVS